MNFFLQCRSSHLFVSVASLNLLSKELASIWSHRVKDLMNQDREVVENTRSCVKIKSKLTNFMKLIRIEGYNGK